MSSNISWAQYKQTSSPEYFQKFTQGQSPTIRTSLLLSNITPPPKNESTTNIGLITVWLGCSDSRVPETTLLGLQPGEVFVHRNIANIVTTSDLNVLAVIEYAVIHLKVAHIVLCGHTSCGGAAAALSDNRVGGVLDAWLTPLRVVRRENKKELDLIKDDAQRAVRLAELNVEEGVKNLMANHVVEEAIRERGLKVHGTLYDLGCGLLRELGLGTDGPVMGGTVSEEKRAELVGGQKPAPPAAAAPAAPAVPAVKEIVTGSHGMLVFKDQGGASLQVQ